MATDIEQQLRDAVKRAGLSLKAISDGSGVGYQSVHGFANGYGGLTLVSAAKLAKFLKLELRPKQKGGER